MIENAMGLAEAARYCRLSESAMRYHVYVAKDLIPFRIGRILVFTPELLNEFMAQKRQAGRPKKKME